MAIVTMTYYLNDVKPNTFFHISATFSQRSNDVVHVLGIIEKDVGSHLNDGETNRRMRVFETL